MKITILCHSIVILVTKDKPQWSLDSCKILHSLPKSFVSIVETKDTFHEIVTNHKVVVSSREVEGSNPVVIHVVKALIGANFSSNVMAKIRILSSSIM